MSPCKAQCMIHQFHMSIVEKVPDGKPATHLRRLDRRTSGLADIAEGAVAQILEEQLRLAILGADTRHIHLRIHMSIDHKEVDQPSLSRSTKESPQPTKGRVGGGDVSGVRGIDKIEITVVAKQGCILVAEVCYQDGEAALVFVITNGHTHIRLFKAILIHGNACLFRHIAKVAIAVVAIQIVGLAIVGNKQVRVSIPPDIGPHRGQAEETLGILDTSLLRDLTEGSVALIVEEIVALALEASRTTLDGHAVILTGFAGAEFRQVVQMEVHIICDKEVGQSIAIIAE